MKAPRNRSRLTRPTLRLLIALSGASIPLVPFAGPTADASGHWVTPGMGAVVHAHTCPKPSEQGELCARVVWLLDALIAGDPSASGDSTADEMIGASLFQGFRWDGERWTGGRIFNPDNGNTYRGSLKLTRHRRLELRGCVLMFCERQTWVPLDAVIDEISTLGETDPGTPGVASSSSTRCTSRHEALGPTSR